VSRKRKEAGDEPAPLYKCPACDKTGSYSEMLDHAIWKHGIGFQHLQEATHEGNAVVQSA